MEKVQNNSRKPQVEPNFGDQPWQNPEYKDRDSKKESKEESSKEEGDSCGCGGSHKSNKKSQTPKRQ